MKTLYLKLKSELQKMIDERNAEITLLKKLIENADKR